MHSLDLFVGTSQLNTSIIVGISSSMITKNDPDLDLMGKNNTETSCDKADTVEDSHTSETNYVTYAMSILEQYLILTTTIETFMKIELFLMQVIMR